MFLKILLEMSNIGAISGRNSASGLRLFQAGSEFSLFYQVREANWRPVGDVTWK